MTVNTMGRREGKQWFRRLGIERRLARGEKIFVASLKCPYTVKLDDNGHAKVTLEPGVTWEDFEDDWVLNVGRYETLWDALQTQSDAITDESRISAREYRSETPER